ncbi:hypothetical protein GOODEAATRI_016867 [Goodea atripinnis]|uniref:TMEM131L fifth Ig-like domain-containing protein n=1 Tax=Goodea atripinnis TaxID=208336 RepID=A0ABV0N2C2_9TELE
MLPVRPLTPVKCKTTKKAVQKNEEVKNVWTFTTQSSNESVILCLFLFTIVLLCVSEIKVRDPNFTLKRTFRVENTGLLPITIKSAEINGQACEGYGFKVLNCQEFALKPNASKELIILFTPDFTSSRVIRELKLVTRGGSEFVFILNASLPYHMLAACAEALPRPSWELELYIIVSVVMRGFYPSSNGTARVGGRQGNSRTLPEPDGQDKRPRIPFSRSSMHATPSQLPKASSSSGQDGPPAPCQLISRKARNFKQLDLQSQTVAGSSLQEDPEYSSLIGAMDNDLDRPESLNTEALQEQNSRAIQSKGTLI